MTGSSESDPNRSGSDSLNTHRDDVSSESGCEEQFKHLMGLAREAVKKFDYEQAINRLTTAEEILQTKGVAGFSMELRFELHHEKGKALAKQGRLQEAIEQHQKILEFCRDSAQLKTRSETFIQIGQLLAKQGDHDRALGYIQRAIGAYRRLGDRHGICQALRNLGVVYVELGEFEEAEINYDEAIALAKEIGDDMLYADLVNNLGTINGMKGNRERALELYADSLKIYRKEGEIRKAAYTENNIGITFIEREMNDEALEYFQRASKIAQQIKDASLALIIDLNLADLYLNRNELDKSHEHCELAEAFLSESDLVNGNLVEAMKIHGKIAARKKHHETSLDYFNRAFEIAQEIRAQFMEAEVLLERGALYMDMDQPFDALNDLEASYHLYRNVKAEGKREQTEKVINSIEKLYLDIFDSMAKKVDRKDKYTKGHSDRVASLALLLGKELGLKTIALKTIVAGALLHDLGKVKIANSIIKKAGKLTDEEYSMIKKHPELGLEVLDGKEFPWDIYPLILHHHERVDGKGYPSGLKGEDIPMSARIICVADVFDALTSDRVYRKAFPTEKALDIMKSDSGTAFDPFLLKTFVGMVESGTADLVINSKTRDDEMFGIWSQCMLEDGDSSSQTASGGLP